MSNMVIGKQRGIGLLELMLAIAILSIMAIAATAFYGSVKENRRIVYVVKMVGDIQNAVSTYVKKPDFKYENDEYDYLPDLISAGLLSPYYEKTPWKGDIAVQIYNASGKSDTIQPQTMIQLGGLGAKAPGKVCERISARLFPEVPIGADCTKQAIGNGCAECAAEYLSARFNLYESPMSTSTR